MEIQEFCRKIELGDEEWEIVRSAKLLEDVWRGYWRLYQQNHQTFYDEILGKEYSEKWFLILYCYFACEVYEQYREKGIGEEIFLDTFRDLTYWCENGKLEFGVTGVSEYQWFWRHFDLTLFRLGRLQFEQTVSQWEVPVCPCLPTGLSVGEPVISIHIPQGSPLSDDAIRDSLVRAGKWFGWGKPYICYSWLLHPSLKEILEDHSRIRKFANYFTLVYVEDNDRDGERRIFGRCLEHPKDYPANTGLQKKAREYLRSGKRIGEGLGILRI